VWNATFLAHLLTVAAINSCQQTATNPVEFALGWRDYSVDPTSNFGGPDDTF